MKRLAPIFLLILILFNPPMSTAKELPKIAVWDLEARETKIAYARELTSILVSEVSKLGEYEVYSQQNIRTLSLTILGQMDIAKLISGSVGKIGNRYSVSLKLFDTQNAKSEKSISEFCRNEDELIELVQTSARKLLGTPVEESIAEKTAGRKGLDKTFTNSIGMEFTLISEGRFVMGSTGDESGRYPNEGPQNEVQITKSFYQE